MIISFNKVGLEATYLNIIKVLYEKPTEKNNTQWGKKMRAFPIRSSKRPLTTLVFSIVLEIFATTIRPQKEIHPNL